MKPTQPKLPTVAEAMRGPAFQMAECRRQYFRALEGHAASIAALQARSVARSS